MSAAPLLTLEEIDAKIAAASAALDVLETQRARLLTAKRTAAEMTAAGGGGGGGGGGSSAREHIVERARRQRRDAEAAVEAAATEKRRANIAAFLGSFTAAHAADIGDKLVALALKNVPTNNTDPSWYVTSHARVLRHALGDAVAARFVVENAFHVFTTADGRATQTRLKFFADHWLSSFAFPEGLKLVFYDEIAYTHIDRKYSCVITAYAL